jgi:uncharacterized protein YjbJ (UPF0337 family)
MNQKELMQRVGRILDQHQTTAEGWSEQPSATVRAKIKQHFEQAKREVLDLLKTHLPDSFD